MRKRFRQSNTARPQKRLPDFRRVNAIALGRLPDLIRQWLPDGRREGNEWVARNPTRADHRPGSFKINLMTGQWGDFATGDTGGDVISLVAYLSQLGQADAARRLALQLGMNDGR
ncbi:hypothetical protein [Oceanibaculum indicum]|uniref:DNA primase n=1 Tax=Oceanibaculum indicum TaxID=526216 RepID=A0A420WN89_9PROT|nr:hypothetical protein [Oceanibaculum indicum]RKQ72501.1 hypothetical protein BCL74_0268 [Oceanibaculum indicum]